MQFEHLFQQGKIGTLRLKNRIIMAPMNVGGNNESDGCLSQRGIDYFVERARGGVGMIITGAVRITRKYERDSNTIPLWMLFADHMIHTKWVSELAERCHDYGTKLCVQLTAGGGRIAGAYAQNNGLAIGPSEVPCFYPPHKNTRELTKNDIHEFINCFEQSARFIKNAGADAIQLHGHQGYLLDQFSCSLWNKRHDEYGGPLENRLRFAKEIISAIKRGAGNDFPIIYRYGLTHFLEEGRSVEEGIEMAKLLEQFGVDALDIDSGCYENNYYPHPPESIACGSFSYLAEYVKKSVSIPVISSTRIGYPEVAEKILESEQSDFVCLGRPLIADPEWPNKAKSGRFEEIRPCLACHEGCLRRLFYYLPLSCAVNPKAGNESYLKLEPAEESKNIVVVGGGVAGIIAALTLFLRGHKVTLYEKNSALGGNFQLDNIPPFKDDYRRYINYLFRQLEKTDIEVVLNRTLDLEDIKKMKADTKIIAVGSSFKRIDYDGLDNQTLINPFDLFKNRDFEGRRILIIGGGLVGIEAAINIKNNGGEPIVIELSDKIASTAYTVNRQHLEVLVKEKGISVHIKTRIINFNGKTANCMCDGEHFSIQFDLVTQCIGMESNAKDDYGPDAIVIGDADRPSNVMNAVWSAYRQCRLI